MVNPLRKFIQERLSGEGNTEALQSVGTKFQESIRELFEREPSSGGGYGGGYTPPFYTTPGPDDPAGDPAEEDGLTILQKGVIGVIFFTLVSVGLGQLFTFEVGS